MAVGRGAAGQLALLACAFLAGGLVRVARRRVAPAAMHRNVDADGPLWGADSAQLPTAQTFDHGVRSSNVSDGAVLGRIGGCRLEECGPFCHRCSCSDPSVCVVCKAGAYLLVRLEPPRETVVSGVCVHECPPHYDARGGGVFNRHCVPEERTLNGQISAVARFSHLSSLPGGGGGDDNANAPLAAAGKAGQRDHGDGEAGAVGHAPAEAARRSGCTCGSNCHQNSCRCVDGGGYCDVCTNSRYNYKGGCFRSCSEVSGLRENGLSVIGRTCVPALAPKTAGYALVHRGATGGEAGLVFSTALSPQAEVFYMFSSAGGVGCKRSGKPCANDGGSDKSAVVTLEACQQRCDEVSACRGIVHYRATHRCRGLSDLGGAPVSTRKEVDSYRKREQ